MSKFCEMNGNINHIAEVSTSRVDGSPTGAEILTSTNVNTGDVRDTLDGKLVKMDQQFQDRFNTLAPIPWTPNTEIKANQSLQVFEHEGLFYLPNIKLLPFTTGATFNADNWGITQLNTTITVNTVADMLVLNVAEKQKITTLGNKSIGDGGAAIYVVISGQVGDGFCTHNLKGNKTAIIQANKYLFARQCGVVDSQTIDSHAAAQACVIYANNMRYTPFFDGQVKLDRTLEVSTGCHIEGSGVVGNLNSFNYQSGTRIRGNAPLLIKVTGEPTSEGWNPSKGDYSAISLSNFSAWSDIPNQKFIEIGEVGGDNIRHFSMRDFELRNFNKAVDIINCYTLFMERFSIRDAHSASGIGFDLRGSAGITSGYVRGGAIYSYDTGFHVESASYGFSIYDVDFDHCNVNGHTTGYVNNPSLFNNCASEFTQISDFIFEHNSSSVVGVSGYTLGGNTKTKDHRIRVKTKGRVILDNVYLNSALWADGKAGLSIEADGSVAIMGDNLSIDAIAWSTDSAIVTMNGHNLVNKTKISPSTGNSWQTVGGSVSFSGKLGTNEGGRRLLIKAENPTAGLIYVHNNYAGSMGVFAISNFLIGGAQQAATPIVIKDGGGCTVTYVSGTTYEVKWSDFYNSTYYSITMPSSARVV